MRKWLIPFILLFCVSIASAGQLRVLSLVLSSGISCTDSGVKQTSTDGEYDIGATTSYQELKAFGGGTVCKVEVWLKKNTATRNVHLEFWDWGKTTQYGTDSDSQSVSVAACTKYTFTWSGTEPTVPNADLRMMIPRESGSAGDTHICTNSDDTSYEDTNYDYWYGGGDRNMDVQFIIYTR